MPECLNPGTANPDIAGLGIIIAFAVQGGISVVLATVLVLMTRRTDSVLRFLLDSLAIGVAALFAVVFKLMALPGNLFFSNELGGIDAVGMLEARDRGDYKEAIQLWLVGSLGTIPRFIRMLVTQGPRIVLLRARRLVFLQGMATKPGVARAISADVEARIEIVNGILIAVSDAQLISGISLLVAALAIHRSLSLYHFHIIYDMTNFTGVSFIAAYSSIFLRNRQGNIRRICAGMLFCVLYLVFSALFGQALQYWDWDGPGRCYSTSLMAMPSDLHPDVDGIYLGFTCFFMFLSCSVPVYVLLFMTTGDVQAAEERAQTVLLLSFLQYPLHLYSVVALRVSNRALLEGDSEDSWGFGQVVALVLLAAVLARCVYGICAWFRKPWRRSGTDSSRPSVRPRSYSA